MHNDQMRKDGSSKSMIQALYYHFVANYVKTRMYSTCYVQIVVILSVSKVHECMQKFIC